MREVFVVLPSQGMESLSLTLPAEECHEILTAWSCVYHPEILRLTGKTASPMYGLYIYDEPENSILIVPSPTLDVLDHYWMERAEERNCVFLKDCSSLEKLTAELLQILREDAESDAEKAKAEKEAENTGDMVPLESSQDAGPERADTAEGSERAETPSASEREENTERSEAAPAEVCGSEKEEKPLPVIEYLFTEDERITDPEMPQTCDFMALGMMHLLSEIMAHKLQYMSYLDSFSFSSSVLDVLKACDEGDPAKAKREMQNVWDQLVQSRQYYAPQDGYLFDMTLLDRSYLPETFTEELKKASAMNLHADGAVIEKMASEFPEMFEELKKKLASSEVCLVGGEETETEFPLLTQEGILRRLQSGLEVYRKHLGRTPEIYARRRFGLTPVLPGILKRLGFSGALHFTLDDGKFPVSEQSRIAWKGMDAQVVEAFSKIPLDARNADSVAGLPETLASSVNIDNAFGAIFTHWAGEGMTSCWYELLKRSSRWIPLFGDLVTFSTCLESTRYSSADERYGAERYVSPYLQQMVSQKEADPISRWTRYHQLRVRLEALCSLESLAVWFGAGKKGKDPESSVSVGETLLDQLEKQSAGEKTFFTTAWQEMLRAERKTAEQISEILSDGTRKNALILLNPSSFPVSKVTDLSEAEKMLSVSRLIPEESGCVKRHFWEKNPTEGRVPVHAARTEVPAHGFALLCDSPELPGAPEEEKGTKRWFFGGKRKSEPLPPPVYRDQGSGMWLLANEHLTLRFDPYTGHLRSVFDNVHRGNRFSQLLAMRIKSAPLDSLAGEAPEEYSIMAADSFKPAIFADRSELEVSGRLMSREGEILARFTQTTILRRGSSVVEFDVYLEPLCEFGRNPWQSYIASRLAWGDGVVDLFRNVGFQTSRTTAFRVESPYFVDIRPIQYTAASRIMSSVTQELAQRVRGHEIRRENFLPERGADTEYSDRRLTLLANGHPWHRNCAHRRLDTLLMVRGETGRRFRFGIAVNTPYPMRTAHEFMAPAVQVPGAFRDAEKHALSGWLGHISHRNVMISHWEADEKGARLRFVETEGRNVRVTYRAMRPLVSAEQVDFRGERINTYAIDGDQVSFDIFANEFREIRIAFS